jgi:hypothetical protein
MPRESRDFCRVFSEPFELPAPDMEELKISHNFVIKETSVSDACFFLESPLPLELAEALCTPTTASRDEDDGVTRLTT